MHAMLVAILLFLAAPAVAGDVRTGLRADSPALNKPLTYSLYLPEGYSGAGTFPVIYLLHGYGGNDREWLERGKLEEILDALIEAGEIPPLIAVMPDAEKSWYVDSAETGGPGDYETAIVRDLLDHVDARYRTNRARSHRMIAGLSMGGYGALRLAFFHPDKFAAVASFSGALFEGVGVPGAGQQGGNTLEAAQKWYGGAFGRPFDPDRYIALSPFARVATLARQQEAMRILITCGDDDYFNFYEGSADLFADLRRAGVAAEMRIDDGGHNWQLWRGQFVAAIRYLTSPLSEKPRRSAR